MSNQIEDNDDLLTNVVEPDENEWKRLVDESVQLDLLFS
jgi:hypothetical protein